MKLLFFVPIKIPLTLIFIFRKVGLLDIEAKDGMADMEWKFLQTKTKAEALKELETEINLIFSDILTIDTEKRAKKRKRHMSIN